MKNASEIKAQYSNMYVYIYFWLISDTLPMKSIAPTKKGEKKKTTSNQSPKQEQMLSNFL